MFKKGTESRGLQDILAGMCTMPGGMLHPTVLWSQSKQTSRFSGTLKELQLLLGSQKELKVTCKLKSKYMCLINGFS